MKYFRCVFSTVLFLFLFTSYSYAAEVNVEPKVSKFHAAETFNKDVNYVNQQLVVKFNATTTKKEKETFYQKHQLKEISSLEEGNFSVVSIKDKRVMASLAKTLLKEKVVEFVEPNFQVEQAYTPKDPKYSNQWYLKTINAPMAWDVTRGSGNIVVAVVDNGVETTHPDLKGKFTKTYNAVTKGTTYTPGAHATHVAGVIAATMNSTGIAGIAPNVKIMPINVFQGDYADTYAVARGIIYAADNGANLINLSLGSYSYSYLLDYSISYASSKGAVLIAAAGNDDTSYPTYPAALSNVLAVSATDKSDVITDFSNYGNYIDLAAPGKDIYSTVTKSSYSNMSGTSMAAPVITGTAALILSKNPYLTPSQVEGILKKSVKDLGSKGWDSYYGFGRIDTNKALSNTAQPISNITTSSKTFTMKGNNSLSVSFTTSGTSTVSVTVQDAKGKTVRKLVSNKKTTGGKISTSWNGKLDNQDYPKNGTYKLVAKITNGKASTTKTTTLKVVDQVSPSITLSKSTFAFSPTINRTITIPFELNRSGKVTAIVYDSKGKVVKTLVKDKAYSAGKKSITWDGKNSGNKRVGDGSYKVKLSFVDANKKKASDKNITIQVDTKAPQGTITFIDGSTFKATGANKKSIKLDLKDNANVTAYITNANGQKIRAIVTNKSYKKGASTISWDGKNDKKVFVSEGNYQFVVESKDGAGNKATTKSIAFKLQDWRTPVIEAPATLTFKKKGNLKVNYKLLKSGKVTIEVFNGAKLVRKINNNQSVSNGSQSFVWDGKDSLGNYVADGSYTYKISIVDKYSLQKAFTGKINVAFSKVTIEYPSVVQLNPYSDVVAEVFYKLSDPAKVTIEIYDSYNDKIKTIQVDQQMEAGNQSFAWDGYDDDGYYYYYQPKTYVIKAVNAGGNTTTVTGELREEANPIWLLSDSYQFIPYEEYDWYNKGFNASIDVSQAAKLTVHLYESLYYDEVPIESKEYSLTKGINSLTYLKPNQYMMEYLDYLLVYEDLLGNKYQYYISDFGSYYYGLEERSMKAFGETPGPSKESSVRELEVMKDKLPNKKEE